MVLAAKRGSERPASVAVAKATKNISAKSAKHFAGTKTKGLPGHAIMSAMKKRLHKG